MSAGNPEKFPWGRNEPGLRSRLVVALVIAVASSVLHYFRAAQNGGLSDFGTVWHGARLMLHGSNPYALIGPGRMIELPSPPYYPAPAFVSAIPFTVLPLHLASTAFVFLSSFLLAFGATRDSWHHLPLFPSVAFITSAQLSQWSILFTAAAFIPAISFFGVVKPQSSIPVIARDTSSRSLVFAAVGTIVLGGISFLLLPTWPRDWWALIRTSDHFSPPIARYAGPLIALVLLKWKRPEAWLVFIAACFPQTWYPYNSLVLLIVAATYREASMLSLISTAGWVAAALLVSGPSRSPEVRAAGEAALIFACFLPATIVVLTRKNVSPSPYWIQRFLRKEGSIILGDSGR